MQDYHQTTDIPHACQHEPTEDLFLPRTFVLHLLEVLHAEHKTAGQILVQHNRVDSQLLWSALKEYLTLEEQIGTVGEAHLCCAA